MGRNSWKNVFRKVIYFRYTLFLLLFGYVVGTKFDAILFDIDSKDNTVGMSCPPRKFVECAVLKNVSNCLENEGNIG